MSALANALHYAATTGPVHVYVGRSGGGNVVHVKGGRLNKYLRVGAQPSQGERVIVIRAGARHIVLTGVTVIG